MKLSVIANENRKIVVGVFPDELLNDFKLQNAYQLGISSYIYMI